MTTYNVLYLTRINAENKKDLTDKANKISELLTEKIHKKVLPYSYMKTDEHVNDVQQKLI